MTICTTYHQTSIVQCQKSVNQPHQRIEPKEEVCLHWHKSLTSTLHGHSQDCRRGGSSTKRLLGLKVQLCTRVLILFGGLKCPSRYWHFSESMSELIADCISSFIIDVFTRSPTSSRPWGWGDSIHSYFISGDLSWSWVHLASCSSPPPTNKDHFDGFHPSGRSCDRYGFKLRRAIRKRLTLHYVTTLATSYYTHVGT